MPVYLIHFERRYYHAGHYLGWTTDLPTRLEAHRKGRGARLMAVISRQGIAWQLARVWPDGDRQMEQRLKRRKSGPRLCPLCRTSAQRR